MQTRFNGSNQVLEKTLWEEYEICVEWCRKERIHTITDLKSRIISDEECEELWLKKCAKMQKELEQNKDAETNI